MTSDPLKGEPLENSRLLCCNIGEPTDEKAGRHSDDEIQLHL
jgi:hypothetical protein